MTGRTDSNTWTEQMLSCRPWGKEPILLHPILLHMLQFRIRLDPNSSFSGVQWVISGIKAGEQGRTVIQTSDGVWEGWEKLIPWDSAHLKGLRLLIPGKWGPAVEEVF